MIGHYLITLTPEQEDRVLTTPMHHGGFTRGCLLGVAIGGTLRDAMKAVNCNASWPKHPRQDGQYVGFRYDALCRRYGEPAINAAIRNRILSNRARRTLRVRELVG